MPALARPGFDRTKQRNRVLIAKIHVAKKEMGLADDDYRALLYRVTGEHSAKDCTDAQLTAVVEELKTKGFKPKPRRSVRTSADHPAARKARALWISLHQLNAIDTPSEAALEAFARRQLHVDALQWADQALLYKLIEALKAIATRHGWSQNLYQVAPSEAPRVLKLRLCEAILAKLKAIGIAAKHWRLPQAAKSLAGIEPGGEGAMFWAIGDIDVVAKALGDRLREYAPKQIGETRP